MSLSLSFFLMDLSSIVDLTVSRFSCVLLAKEQPSKDQTKDKEGNDNDFEDDDLDDDSQDFDPDAEDEPQKEVETPTRTESPVVGSRPRGRPGRKCRTFIWPPVFTRYHLPGPDIFLFLS